MKIKNYIPTRDAYFSKKFKILEYFDSKNTTEKVYCESLKMAKFILKKNCQINHNLITK